MYVLASLILLCCSSPPRRPCSLFEVSTSFRLSPALTSMSVHHQLVDFLDRVRAHFKLPLAVGFGLSTRAHITSVGKIADGAIMGSAIVRAIRAGGETTEARCASVAKFIEGVLKD